MHFHNSLSFSQIFFTPTIDKEPKKSVPQPPAGQNATAN
jgi:hypothetical protein